MFQFVPVQLRLFSIFTFPYSTKRRVVIVQISDFEFKDSSLKKRSEVQQTVINNKNKQQTIKIQT